MIKACIVGCGKIADIHADAISRFPEAEIVGVCDTEELMAKQLYERFKVKQYFSDIRRMLEIAKPDVVHITTPPQSHFELGRIALEAGCHIYVEKPFTVDGTEAAKLIDLANRKDLKLTVGTDEQFSHVAVAMRKLVHDGYLGGPPVHMEAYYCYDLGDARFAQAFLKNNAHWLRRLPGQLMHNIISHGIAKIVEYLPGESADVIALGFTSRFLSDLGEKDLVDELRLIIRGADEVTAYFTFSTQMRPLLREFRVYGPKNGLALNQDNHYVITLSGTSPKSYLGKFLPLNDLARQYRRNMFANMKWFMKNDFHMKEGMHKLVRSFYASIANEAPPPIPYREILLTTKIMDSVFQQAFPNR
jgi:predicted dehydrogenase